MKPLYIFLLFITTITFANTTPPTDSKIKAVTVFVDGAQITRTVKINLPVGTTEFSFTNLSPYIQENSIQISGLNDASILSINYAINHLSKLNTSDKIEQLKNDMETLGDAILLEDDIISGYQEELNVIKENRTLGNDNIVVSLAKLQEFAAYYRKRITEVNVLINKSQKKKRDFQKEISDINKQLNELNVDDKIQSGEIKAKLHSTSPKELNLIIKYNVKNAGWFPNYDLKAKNINQPVDLHYKAHVYQNTGVIWENVKLTLSTNDPNTNNLKPEMDTKYLNFVSRNSNYTSANTTKRYDYKHNPFVKHVSGTITDVSGVPLPGVNIVLKGTGNGTSTDFDGNFSIEPQGAQELEVSYLGYISQTIPIHSSIINLSLQEDLVQLDEVVVVGYSSKKASSTTGSISNISPTSNINIRGFGSYTFKGEPLYVIDGISMSASSFKKLDKDLIANIEVLKDASSAAIYGSRGSNGVILITTKENYTSNGDIISEGINNTNFEIQKLSTIEFDGNITVINIDKYTVPASFSYFAAPVINENVFLTAKISNWQQYNLLPGEVNVYFEDSYSGITTINPYATTDSLTVSLGIDPNVVIKRKPINNFKKNNFIGNNKVIDKAYEIELKNNKNTAVDVVIVDRIPISQNKDIKLEDIETGNADYDTKKGVLTWKIKAKPNVANNYNFSYVVKYPKFRKINL